MSSQQLVFFDLPSKEPLKAWSLNPWRIRMALNYKGIDYKTEWTEYPNIRPRLEKHLPGLKDYTIPTVIMPNGEYVMDSWKIAEVLETAFPGTPSLHLDAPALAGVKAALVAVMPHLVGIYIPLVPQRILNEASQPYWYKTRPQWFGMPLDQLAREKGGDPAFQAAAPHLREATALLREKSAEGPFFLGATPSFADFVWAGFLVFFQRIGDDVFQKLIDATGDRELNLKFLEAVKPWAERDDH